MLPHKLKQFNIFNDGQSFLGVASEIELPKLTMQAEEYRGAGMLAPVDVDLGLEKLTMGVTYGGMVRSELRRFGLTQVDGAMMRFVGAYQGDDTGLPTAAELVVRGRHTEIDPGSAKAGDDTEWKTMSTLTYLKWTVNGVTEVEIDVINAVYKTGGVDRMAAIRAIIGS